MSAALVHVLACTWTPHYSRPGVGASAVGTAVGATGSSTVSVAGRPAAASLLMMGRRAVARERGRVREAEKAAGTDFSLPPQLLHARRQASRGVSIASVSLPRQNYAVIHYSNGSTTEWHTPSLDQRADEAEWLAVRSALEMTASEFAAAKDEWRHASRATVLARKLGRPEAMFRGNAATAFGTQMEPRAVRLYERVTGHSVAPTGLHMHPNCRWGASPDGIVSTSAGEVGLLEVKCSFRLRSLGVVPQLDRCPDQFFDQIQGQLAITGLAWCDLFYYVPARKASGGGHNWCLVRVEADPEHFASLVPHLDEFAAELKAARWREGGAVGVDADGMVAEGGVAEGTAQTEGAPLPAQRTAEGHQVAGPAGPSTAGSSDPDPTRAAAPVAPSRGGARTGVRRHRARLAAHSDLLRLVTDLIAEARSLPAGAIFVEAPLAELPAELGLGAAGAPLLSPDAVAADTVAGEVLIAEVTIVPDPALGRYYAKKLKKYAWLPRAVDEKCGFSVRPPMVVAVGESGGVYPSSAVALREALPLLTDERLARFEAEAARLAQNRPGARRARRRPPGRR